MSEDKSKATAKDVTIFSWNVNGIRAVIKKQAFEPMIEKYAPDILCIQETKAKPGQVEIDLPEYTEIWNSAERAGYSGTAILTKIPPLRVTDGFPEDLEIAYPWGDDRYGSPLTEGRLQTAEFKDFYVVNVYAPNSKPDLSRLALREKLWDPALNTYLAELQKHKPVVICGDFNAARTEIDLARPSQNEHNAGYTPEERQGMTNFLTKAQMIDSFRWLHPEERKYTWWTWRAGARQRNIGWRIDYILISRQLEANLRTAEIHNDVLGSDHCPVSIRLGGMK